MKIEPVGKLTPEEREALVSHNVAAIVETLQGALNHATDFELGEMYGSLRLLHLQTDMDAKSSKDCADAIAQIQAEYTARHHAREKALEEGGPIVDGRLRWERDLGGGGE